MDALAEIERLVAFEGRAPGSDAERRAADHLAGRLRSLGRDAGVEAFWTWPGWAPTHLLHAALALLGSVTSVYDAPAGIGLLALALVSTVLDLTGRLHLGRRLTSARASQNVVSYEEGDKPGVLVLVAHYDAARTGAPFRVATVALLERLRRIVRYPVGLFQLFTGCIVVLLACAVARALGVDSLGLSAVQFVPTLLLVLCVPALVEVTLSRAVPGANDNASGVATALRLAERHGGDLEHFDLWVVLPGAEEGLLLGMQRWLRRHRRELDRRLTVFVGLDRVGIGSVRYARREGFLVRRPYHRQLLGLCEATAEALGGAAIGVAPASATAVRAARRRRYPAVAVSCGDDSGRSPHHHLASDTPERIEGEALEGAFEFASALIERIDREAGPDVAALAKGGRAKAAAHGEAEAEAARG